MAIITGVAAGAITATCVVSDDGLPIDETESSSTAQSIENDIATLGAIKLAKSGDTGTNVTLDGNTTIADAAITVATIGSQTTSGIATFARTRIGPMAYLSTADQTLYDSVTSGCNYIYLAANPGADVTLTLPQPAAWSVSTAYVIGNVRKNGGNIYVCDTNGTSAASGGPTGTGNNIVDGTTRWDYVGLAPVDGDWFSVTAQTGNTVFFVLLKRAGSANNVAFLGSSVGAVFQAGSAIVRFDGTNWRLVSLGGFAGYGVDS